MKEAAEDNAVATKTASTPNRAKYNPKAKAASIKASTKAPERGGDSRF
jgi:hypothetical protein